MKINISIALVMFFINYGKAQIFTESKEKNKFEIGFHTAYTYGSHFDKITNEKTYIVINKTEPFIGIYPFKKTNLLFGIKGEYQFLKSNVTSMPDLYSVGIYSRYIFNKKLKYSFLNRFRLFSELNTNLKNYKYTDNMPVQQAGYFTYTYPEHTANLRYLNFNIVSGIIFNIWKGFNLELSGQYSIYIKGSSFIEPRISLSYIFKEKNTDNDNYIRTAKRNNFIKQKETNKFFLNSFSAGSSLTYIWDDFSTNLINDDYFLVFITNSAFELVKLQLSFIWS
ncbi:MAG: hypothetical protein L3J56_05415 [Bacteroidales bacterium]|nr:hypothetical protein [Bacteroidales bacterium]